MRNTSRKKKLFFLLTIITAVLTFTFAYLVLLLPIGNIKILLLIGVLILGIILMNLFKYHLEYQIYNEQLYLLFSSILKPYVVKLPIMTEEWIRTLPSYDYKMIKDFKSVKYYYKFDVLSEKSRKHKVLILLALIQDNTIDFDSEFIINHINQIELILRKETKFQQRIFIHCKSFSQIDDDALKSTKNIFWIRKGRQYITSLNLSYFIEDKKVFYVENPDYSFNRYYEFAIKQIKNIL